MPMIDVYAPDGTFDDPHALAQRLAGTVMTVEGVPDIPMFRENTAAFIHPLPASQISNVDGGSDYVRVQVLTNAGALDRPKQLALIARLTEVIAAAPGNPPPADRIWVLVTEAPDGGWGLWGHAHTNADLVAAARSRLTAATGGTPAPVRDAKTILLECLLSFTDPPRAAAYFAEDGVFEIPYLASVDIAPRYVGRAAIQGFLELILQLYPDWQYHAEEFEVLIDTPDHVFAEYRVHPTSAATGRRINHLFMGRCQIRDGQIALLREAINTVAAARALLPGGPADLAPPGPIVDAY